MIQDEQHPTSPTDCETSSLIFDGSKKHRPSMIYSVLPVVVQNRIPTLPSLRRSISGLHGRSRHGKSGSIDSEVFQAPSPPPSYSSRPGSGTVSPDRNSIALPDIDESEIRDDVSERPSSSRYSPPPFSVSVTETESGVNWRYASQGISLVNQAHQESYLLAQNTADGSATLTRQLYMHGLTYLLRAIPADLTPEERMSLQASIPNHLLDPPAGPPSDTLVRLSHNTGVTRRETPHDASLLHRLTAMIVFQAFVLLQFLLPYIKLLIGHAYRLEREHKITQRIVNTGLITVDEIGRRSLKLSHTVCQMGDGKVGQAINDLTFWWIRGLTGGIQEGISDGVVMFEYGTQPKPQVEKLE